MTLHTAAVYCVFVGGGAVTTFFLATALISSAPDRLCEANYRGVPVPRVLGVAAWGAVLVMVVGAAAGEGITAFTSWQTWAVALGATLVAAAGMLDDLVRGGPRGLRAHLRSALVGTPTTGVLKVVVALIAGIMVALAFPRGSLARDAAGVVAMAGAANLWNGLDVAPGRAVKAFLVAGLAIASAPPQPRSALLLAAVGAAAVALWFDLKELAMLGDSGANVLGFVVGAFLYRAVPWWALFVAAGVIVGLNLLAETITLSRIIGSVRPLRWLDELGRRPEWRERFRTRTGTLGEPGDPRR